MTLPTPPPTSPAASVGPLAGLRVVVTRPAHQAAGLLRAFEAAGADARPLPLLAVVEPRDPIPLATAARGLSDYRWVVFSSSNSVRALCERVPDHRLPPGIRVAAVGPATARVIRRRGRQPDLVARDPHAEGLADELRGHIEPGDAVLLPQASDARPVLARELLRLGADLTVVIAYRKTASPLGPETARRIFADGPLGWVTFTSPRIARTFAGLFGDRWEERRATLRAISIGPVTTHELRRLGVEPAAEAAEPEDRGMVAAVCRARERPG